MFEYQVTMWVYPRDYRRGIQLWRDYSSDWRGGQTESRIISRTDPFGLSYFISLYSSSWSIQSVNMNCRRSYFMLETTETIWIHDYSYLGLRVPYFVRIVLWYIIRTGRDMLATAASKSFVNFIMAVLSEFAVGFCSSPLYGRSRVLVLSPTLFFIRNERGASNSYSPDVIIKTLFGDLQALVSLQFETRSGMAST